MNGVVLTLLLLSLTFFCVSNAGLMPLKHHRVSVVNLLSNNKVLKVHCKSKDDDLGIHMVSPRKHYRFEFDVNMRRTTLFFCNLWQGPNDARHVVFDAFKVDEELEKECGGDWRVWVAKDSGIRLLNAKYGSLILEHHWDETPSFLCFDTNGYGEGPNSCFQ